MNVCIQVSVLSVFLYLFGSHVLIGQSHTLWSVLYFVLHRQPYNHSGQFYTQSLLLSFVISLQSVISLILSGMTYTPLPLLYFVVTGQIVTSLKTLWSVLYTVVSLYIQVSQCLVMYSSSIW